MRIIRLVCFLVLVSANNAEAQRSDTIVKIAGAPRYAGINRLVEELSIGVVNGPQEYMFAASLNEALPARDGTVWIADDQALPGSSKLRQYDASGKFLRSIGRAGQGPGEFLELRFVEQLPDGRVLALDRRLGEVVLHIYSEKGEAIAQHDVALRGPVSASRGVRRVTIGSPFAPHVESVWSPLGYWITGISSRYAVDLRQPLTPTAGQTTRPATWRIGDPVVSIRRAVAPVAVSNEERQDRARYMEEQLASEGGTLSGPIPRVAAVKPAFRSIFVSDEGRLWVQVTVASERYEPAARTSRDGRMLPRLRWHEPLLYDVFEPDGLYLGQVSVPYDTRVLTVRGDVVWAVALDADDVKSVKRFRIAWGSR